MDKRLKYTIYIISGIVLLYVIKKLLISKVRAASTLNLMAIEDITEQIPVNPDAGIQWLKRDVDDINKIVIHHSATTSGTPVAYANYHINERGWPGIAYHYHIAKDGSMQQVNNLTTIAGHTDNYGVNKSSIGIVLTGNYDVETIPAQQLNALVKLIRGIQAMFGKLDIYGHSDFQDKTCPGKNIDIGLIKQLV